MTTGLGKSCGAVAAEAPRSVSLSVLPSKPAKRPVARSKVSKWRAGVLITVNVLMVAHIVQWVWSVKHGTGRTLGPVEPSETMYAVEVGRINPGFVFFTGALLATFLFGRFFCGWGCHIVALQDLCAHWMKKLGVRPKPFRTRVMLLGPLILALYMFVWPTFKRVVMVPLEPAVARMVGAKDAERWHYPEWLVSRPPSEHPGFNPEFFAEDYWKTFPSEWYVIVPFLGVCGFAAVYLLGSKGFCTYGCPYGGFFAPMDKVSVGRIVVDHDKCEQCGHCTAVCTSNVRVSQEVHDYGMVVDPGCMKCLDCVSVCPNDALSFSFARPAVVARAVSEEAKQGRVKRPEWDVPLWMDVVLLGVAVLLFFGFRGMFYKVPLLMAAGMGIAGAFLAWKLWSLAAEPNVRLQSLQLKLKGRVRPAGVVVGLFGAVYVAAGLWGAVVQGLQIAANRHDLLIKTSFETVFSPGYKPSDEDAVHAAEMLRLYRLAGAPRDGGIGWDHNGGTYLRLAWGAAVAGDLNQAEAFLRRAIDGDIPAPAAWVFNLAQVMQVRGATPDQVRATLEDIVSRRTHLFEVRLALAEDSLSRGNKDEAARIAAEVLADTRRVRKPSAASRAQAGTILLRAGKAAAGAAALESAVERGFDTEDWVGLMPVMEALLQYGRAARAAEVAEALLAHSEAPPGVQMHAVGVMLQAQKGEASLKYLPQIMDHKRPRPDAVIMTQIGDLYLQAGKMEESERALARAVSEYPGAAFAHATYARALAINGKNEAALKELEAACRLEPTPEYLSAKGELLNAMGRPAEAQKALEEAQGAAGRVQPRGR